MSKQQKELWKWQQACYQINGVIWERLEKEPSQGWAGWRKDLARDKGLGGDNTFILTTRLMFSEVTKCCVFKMLLFSFAIGKELYKSRFAK